MPFIHHVAIPERRLHPRIEGNYRALIRFVDRGIPEERLATLLNLSARGCFLALDYAPSEQTKVFILTRMSSERFPVARGPRLALRGVVVRVSCQRESPGVGVRLTSHRFLLPDPQKAF